MPKTYFTAGTSKKNGRKLNSFFLVSNPPHELLKEDNMLLYSTAYADFGCPRNPVVFPSSDGEVEFAKEEQDPDAKGGERPQPPRIRDDPGNP
jgi:hypothetical protein